MKPVYLLYPLDRQFPGILAWIDEAVSVFEESNPQFSAFRIEYDTANNFAAMKLASRIITSVGPIVIVHPVQAKPVRILRQRSGTRSEILEVPASCSEDVWAALEKSVQLVRDGFPQIAFKMAAAVLVVRKLIAQEKWGGKKGYLWGSDLPRGGIPASLVDSVMTVADELKNGGVLITKISNGSLKYALNSARTDWVHQSANGDFSFDPRLRKILDKDTSRMVSSVLLEEDFHIQKIGISTSGSNFESDRIEAVLDFAEKAHEKHYRICVYFNKDRKLVEPRLNKSDMMEFLGGFHE